MNEPKVVTLLDIEAREIAKTTEPGSEARWAALGEARMQNKDLKLRLAVEKFDPMYWDNLRTLRLNGINMTTGRQ